MKFGKFIVENMNKSDNDFKKLFESKFSKLIKESLSYDIKKQLEEEDEEDEMANDILNNNEDFNGENTGLDDEIPVDIENDDMEIDSIEPTDNDEFNNEEAEHINVNKVVLNADKVKINTSNENETIETGEEIKLDDNIDDGEEVSIEESEDEYEKLLNEVDDIEMGDSDNNMDIELGDSEDDESKDMMTDEDFSDEMVINADTIEINANEVITDTDEEIGDEIFDDDDDINIDDNIDTEIDDENGDIINIENEEDIEETNKKKINPIKKVISEEDDDSEKEMMDSYEQYLNDKESNSGTNLRKQNPEEFAKKYSEWAGSIVSEKTKRK